jgi:chemotaxis protein MotB
MARRKRNEEAPERVADWLLTYSDLVTLLLTFFVLLFSMATIDKQKFEQVATSLQSRFTQMSSGEIFNTNKGKDIFAVVEVNNAVDEGKSDVNNDPEMKDIMQEEILEGAEAIKARKLENVKKQIEKAIIDLGIEEYVTIIEEKEIVVLRFDSLVLFDIGKAHINASGKDALQKLGIILKQLDNDITIQGHTDNLPINTREFPTNWELSTRRATNVVLFLIDKCDVEPSKLTAEGNGEYKPIRPNDTEENRQKNRRIDIVIEK